MNDLSSISVQFGAQNKLLSIIVLIYLLDNHILTMNIIL